MLTKGTPKVKFPGFRIFTGITRIRMKVLKQIAAFREKLAHIENSYNPAAK